MTPDLRLCFTLHERSTFSPYNLSEFRYTVYVWRSVGVLDSEIDES